MCTCAESCPNLWPHSVAPCTVACQAPLSMGFPRQKYWSGLPCPLLGHFPDPGTEPLSLQLLHWQAYSLPTEPPGKPKFFSLNSIHCSLLFINDLTSCFKLQNGKSLLSCKLDWISWKSLPGCCVKKVSEAESGFKGEIL